MVEFGDRDIVTPAKPILKGPQNLSFFFERVRMLDMDFEREQTEDRHGP